MKKIEYGNDFNYSTFLFGKSICRNNLLGKIKNIKDINLKSFNTYKVDFNNAWYFFKTFFIK